MVLLHKGQQAQQTKYVVTTLVHMHSYTHATGTHCTRTCTNPFTTLDPHTHTHTVFVHALYFLLLSTHVDVLYMLASLAHHDSGLGWAIQYAR